GAQNKVIRPFGKHDIALHIDDGCMGGGESIKHTETLSEDEFNDLFDKKYNTNEGFTQSRKKIFHYCIFADNIWTGRSGKSYSSNKFVVADGHSVVNPIIGSHVKGQAGSFMHELGHSLGLFEGSESKGPGYFPGIDNDKSDDWTWPWNTDHPYHKYKNYKSCMNYRYQTEIIDYSDGNHGSGDHDDWSDIMITIKNIRS
ncbi:MAG: hypothetical protein DRN57_01380, partial [Thermoplasmata archaeon]